MELLETYRSIYLPENSPIVTFYAYNYIWRQYRATLRGEGGCSSKERWLEGTTCYKRVGRYELNPY